jgi:hypothetical protein
MLMQVRIRCGASVMNRLVPIFAALLAIVVLAAAGGEARLGVSGLAAGATDASPPTAPSSVLAPAATNSSAPSVPSKAPTPAVPSKVPTPAGSVASKSPSTSRPSATSAPVTDESAPSNATTPAVPGLEAWSQSLSAALRAKVAALFAGGAANDVLAFLVACANNTASRMPLEVSELVLEVALGKGTLSAEALASVQRYTPEGVQVPASLLRADASGGSPTQPPVPQQPSTSSATSANDGRLALLIGASAGGCAVLAAGAVVLVAVRRARDHAIPPLSSSFAFSAASGGSASSKGSFGAVGPFGSATARRERKKEQEQRPTSFNKFTSFGRDLVTMMNPKERVAIEGLL